MTHLINNPSARRLRLISDLVWDYSCWQVLPLVHRLTQNKNHREKRGRCVEAGKVHVPGGRAPQVQLCCSPPARAVGNAAKALTAPPGEAALHSELREHPLSDGCPDFAAFKTRQHILLWRT